MRSERKRTVSVVMPVRNEATHIARSIEAILAQEYPSELIEVIVADGMSTDGTRETVAEMARRCSRLKLIDNPRQIAPTALNLAIHEAKGEIIIRVDGHCEIAPNYVSRCVEYLESGQAECVGGPLETIGEGYIARAVASAMSSRFGVGGAAFRTVKDRTLYVDTVAFPAMKRETLRYHGAFDEMLVRNQDDEYSYRLRENGARILLAQDVKSKYYSRSSIRRLARQYFQYGLYKVRVMQQHPSCMSLRQFVPAAFVSAIAVSCVAAFSIPSGWMLVAGIVSAYAVMGAVASLGCASRDGWSLLPVIPVCFLTLHLSYGTGFLCGLARFGARSRAEARGAPSA